MDTLKIYFIEYDKDGNEIRRGVHPKKEYKTYGRAWKVADELYGDRERYEVYIDTREPWGEYHKECTCDICKKTFVCGVDAKGLIGNIRVDIADYRNYTVFRTRKEMRESEYLRTKTWHSRTVCPECYEKISNFMDSITVED